MQTRRKWSRVVGASLLGSLLLSGLLEGSASAGEKEKEKESLATNVIYFDMQTQNAKGSVRCGLFNSKDTWLKKTFQASVVTINGTSARCVFKEVPAGHYGLSAFHDEDDDGELDTNVVGYPIEEYCASNNARNMFSAPSWSDAKFKYKGGTVTKTADLE
jgi:uncharacterized protein (DUF2141 family)